MLDLLDDLLAVTTGPRAPQPQPPFGSGGGGGTGAAGVRGSDMPPRQPHQAGQQFHDEELDALLGIRQVRDEGQLTWVLV